jgi:hypothetical protein
LRALVADGANSAEADLKTIFSLLSLVVFMKKMYLEELHEAYSLYSFNIGCYEWIACTRNGAPNL